MPSPTGVLSVLDRATHLPSVLLSLAFALALDVSTSYGIGSSLLSMSWDAIQRQITIGHALVFFVVFGMYMALGVVLMRYLANELMIHTVVIILRKLSPEVDFLKAPYAYAVRLSRLREAAHMEQNQFYFDRYTEQQNTVNEFEGLLSRLASHAFACLMLMGVDGLILPSYGYPSILRELSAQAPDTWWVISSMLALGLVTLWLFPLLRDSSHDEWVYCPILYRQKKKKKAKAQNERMLPTY